MNPFAAKTEVPAFGAPLSRPHTQFTKSSLDGAPNLQTQQRPLGVFPPTSAGSSLNPSGALGSKPATLTEQEKNSKVPSSLGTTSAGQIPATENKAPAEPKISNLPFSKPPTAS